MKQFYVTNTSNIHDQALIIDEETGRNVAVCYDKKDAPLLAAAPDLLKACKRMMEELERLRDVHLPRFEGKIGEPDKNVIRAGCRATAKAEEKSDATAITV